MDGHLGNNQNCNISLQGDQNEISNNKNSHVEGFGSNAQVCGNTNTNISLDNVETPRILNSKNCDVKVHGPGEINFRGNLNTQLAARFMSFCNLGSSKNASVEVDGGSVSIADCKNLRVSGDKHDLKLNSVENHEVLTSKIPNINKLSVEVRHPNRQGYGILQSFFNNGPDVQFRAEYAERAEINGMNYRMGIFNFWLDKQATYSAINFGDNVHVERIIPQGNAATVYATGNNGVKQQLEISGPGIEIRENPPQVRVCYPSQ